MRFFSQSYLYDDSWSIVTLAFFLRYPNPYAAHVLSCDVISRDCTPSGTLVTKRLILKQGNLPRWFPKGIVSRAESWVIEESEVDPYGQVVRCTTRNLDHVKVMQVEESVKFAQTTDGKTLQHTEGRVFSRFGWGLTKKIENHGLNKFKANLQRSREGVSVVLSLLRQSRLQPMTLGAGVETPHELSPSVIEGPLSASGSDQHDAQASTSWQRLKSWFQPPSSSASS
ncbi:MSF1-domain-containing protein [Crepidotus variabilis]|uniref:MSF1-domain-containing protein n=1 Tax=Crepidotus variabilis TaxID=179855 RepID=A0A9P6E6S1_9AGAR|nr:MSF1-domain-containing protein [Crepidotus variabilis]